MKLIIKKHLLLKGIQSVEKNIGRNLTLPVLSNILIRTQNNKKISEYWFFCYISLLSLVIVGFIFSFSLFYFHTFSLEHGHMKDGNNYINLDRSESILYSSYTFFNMNYKNYIPDGWLTKFTIIEMFISQIIFITFIAIMAAKLIDNLKLKGVKNGE